jgi:RNA polymerase sigma-70 factor (ECF subfamily)
MFKVFRSSPGKEAASAQPTDAQLVHDFVVNGNTALLGLLFERYSHLVFGLCMKYLKNTQDAEDAVMGIFEKLMTDLHKHEVRDFKNWLYMVSKNHCLMILRKSKVNEKATENIMHEMKQEFMENLFGVHHLNNEEGVEGNLISLYDAIHALREEQRICIELMYFEKYSYREIAEITGYEMNEVKSHIQNGKRNLKNILDPK